MKLSDLVFQSHMYLAFELSDKSRSELLKLVPPSFSKIICHHVTIEFSMTESRLKELQTLLGGNPNVAATGHLIGRGIECFTVEINGNSNRSDGSFYHVTESLDPPHKPVESNSLIKSNGGLPEDVFSRALPLIGVFKLIPR